MTIIPHNRLTYGPEEADAVADVVRSGMWASGPEVAKLEGELASTAGRRGAAAVGSGLGALRLALRALGIGSGDKVVIPAYSCVALANAVLACGAEPLSGDVLAGDWTLDPASVASLDLQGVRAIVAVHTFGVPANIASLREMGIPVIEDCAHGPIATGTGADADVAMTSFYATKLIGAGEGGAVLSDRPEVLDYVRQARDYGDQPADGTRLNDKMSDLHAALGRCALRRLGQSVEARAVLAARYLELLLPLADKGVMALPQDAGDRVWYRFAVELNDRDADGFIAALAARGVRAEQPVWDWRERQAPGSVSDRAFERLVSLPLYPTLERSEQDTVVKAVFEAAGEAGS